MDAFSNTTRMFRSAAQVGLVKHVVPHIVVDPTDPICVGKQEDGDRSELTQFVISKVGTVQAPIATSAIRATIWSVASGMLSVSSTHMIGLKGSRCTRATHGSHSNGLSDDGRTYRKPIPSVRCSSYLSA